jgi:hypothetical protein
MIDFVESAWYASAVFVLLYNFWGAVLISKNYILATGIEERRVDEASHLLRIYCCAAAKYKHGNKLTNVKLKTFSTCHSVLKVLEELKTPIKLADVGKKVDNIYKQIQFVGVSINPMDATRGGDNYVSALVSGLFTLVNTGEQLIEAGDIVVWSCDNLKLCKDNVRMPMSTVPLRTEKTSLLQKFKEQLQFRTADPLVQRMYDKKECSEDDLALLFESVTNDINIDATNRVIGQAMSSAKPGGAFDILIGSQRR